MTLRELLSYIDFDAKLDEHGEIVLIDEQGAYLGNIGEERWDTKSPEETVTSIIDRLEIYWRDYEVTPLCEDMNCEEPYSWKDLYDKAVDFYGNDVDKNTILKYLIHPDLVVLDEELIKK